MTVDEQIEACLTVARHQRQFALSSLEQRDSFMADQYDDAAECLEAEAIGWASR